jgi:GntR family transcriptional regulator, transcriptional repressor for pyruvate dehydrogenase complex
MRRQLNAKEVHAMSASANSAAPPPTVWRKPLRLYGAVAHNLAQAVIQGRYAPGEFLPTEQELATEYGASRNVVREALRLVSARGMIEVLHGKGSRVLPRHQWQLLDQLVHLMQEDRRVPQDLLELRRILEVEIAGLAAERATSNHFGAMAITIDQMRAESEQPEVCIEHDIQFHRLLAEAAGNVLFPLVLEPVGQLLRASRVSTIHNPGAIDRSVAAHQEILDRVRTGDVAGAQGAMRRHLLQVEGEIHRLKEEREPSAAG